jgi:hypothetical protein
MALVGIRLEDWKGPNSESILHSVHELLGQDIECPEGQRIHIN